MNCEAGAETLLAASGDSSGKATVGPILSPEFQAITTSKDSHGCSIVYKFLID